MKIKKQYLQKYLHDIAIQQISDEYIEKGYAVSKEEQIGKYQADIIARKSDETIVIEVKSGKMTSKKKESIEGIANYVRSLGKYKFFVVIATAPKEKKLEIEEIEELLFQNFMNDLPSELDELSTHTTLEEITDVDIDEILITGNSISIKGNAVVSVNLQIGSGSDQKNDNGINTSDNFPFDFDMILGYNNNKLQIIDAKSITVDTSAFYE